MLTRTRALHAALERGAECTLRLLLLAVEAPKCRVRAAREWEPLAVRAVHLRHAAGRRVRRRGHRREARDVRLQNALVGAQLGDAVHRDLRPDERLLQLPLRSALREAPEGADCQRRHRAEHEMERQELPVSERHHHLHETRVRTCGQRRVSAEPPRDPEVRSGESPFLRSASERLPHRCGATCGCNMSYFEELRNVRCREAAERASRRQWRTR